MQFRSVIVTLQIQKIISIEDAVKKIDRNANIFIHGSAMTPIPMLDEMAKQYQSLEKLNLFSITVGQDCAILHDPFRSHFYMNSLFVSPAVRENINTGFGDYIPVFLAKSQSYLEME